MLSKYAISAVVVVMGLSLAACVSPSDPRLSQQAVAAPETPTQTAPASPSPSNPLVDSNFKSGGGRWERVGSILFRYTAIERDGEVYICGAFTGRGARSIRQLSREVMRQASVTSNGQTIQRNMRFFTEASNSNFGSRLVGVETTCRSTGKSVQEVPLDSIRMGTREGRYSISR